MRGGFDLYGTYYPNANNALNAEMAQRNEIDNRSNSKKLSEQDKTINYDRARISNRTKV